MQHPSLLALTPVHVSTTVSLSVSPSPSLLFAGRYLSHAGRADNSIFPMIHEIK